MKRIIDSYTCGVVALQVQRRYRRNPRTVAAHGQLRAAGLRDSNQSPLRSRRAQDEQRPVPSSVYARAALQSRLAGVPDSARSTPLTASADAASLVPDAVAAPIAPVAMSSPNAYDALLRAHHSSFVTLLRAPFAPTPLEVLMDVLSLRGGKAVLADLTVLHVEDVFSSVRSELRDAQRTVALVGDADSERQLNEISDKVQRFQELLQGEADVTEVLETHGGGEKGRAAALYRCQLALASLLGMTESCVLLLDKLRRTDEAALRGECGSASDASGVVNVPLCDLGEVAALEIGALASSARQQGVQAHDHLLAMQSCALRKEYSVCSALYQQLVHDALRGSIKLSEECLQSCVVALANACGNTSDFASLRELLVESDLSKIPVSSPLYASITYAASRAVADSTRLPFSLSLYRRLRDANIVPCTEMYAALLSVCASCKEPTIAFAFYREALAMGEPSSFPPALYTNLILSYATAGYFDDAKKTLEVLLEAEAPLTRAAFHAAMLAAPSQREAQEVVNLMTARSIAVTPTTCALMLDAETRALRGIDSLLFACDCHAACLSWVHRGGRSLRSSENDDDWADEGKRIAANESQYCESLEMLLLSCYVDVTADKRLATRLAPLTRVVQQYSDDYVVAMRPQQPTKVPCGSFVAVLTADVLANLEEWFLPSAYYFSSIVIPHSSIAAMRRGTAKFSDKGTMSIAVKDSKEFGMLSQRRRSSLERFLKEFSSVIHLMSLAEEMQQSGDLRRYGLRPKQLPARAAAVALNLARGLSCTQVYKDNRCRVVLTTSMPAVSKVVRAARAIHSDGSANTCGTVSVWNPTTLPTWDPRGRLSAPTLAQLGNDPDGGASIADTALHCDAATVDDRAANGDPPAASFVDLM